MIRGGDWYADVFHHEIDPHPEWRQQANCRGLDPELFFPERGDSQLNAKAVCAGCPVQARCLEYAEANNIRLGIWGGFSERQRRTIRRATVAA